MKLLDLTQRAQGIYCDHREALPGGLFFEIPGSKFDPATVRKELQNRGVTVVGEREGVDFQVPNVRRAYAEACAAFYKNPSHSMKVVGVTGTSGKTTTTYLLEAILNAAGFKVGVIGTINTRYLGKVVDSNHTTPMAGDLQKILAEMRDAGVTAVVMEVSSHALKQHRSDAIAFDVAVFTNLTPEHMDYHPDLEDYFLSKARLFRDDPTSPKKLRSVINVVNPYGERLANEVKARKQWVTEFGSSSDALRLSTNGIEGSFLGVEIRCPLEGEFNRINIQGAVGAALALGVKPEKVAEGLNALKGVPGRMERVAGLGGSEPRVYVDYAHKPDALQKVLESLQGISKKVITIFGCGGDRDRTKRPVMGKIASELSAWVVVTSDNPRTENPETIIQEILAGIPEHKRDRVHVEVDRRAAIIKAIHDAPPDATILIAGKGHEDYQILGTTKVPMSDVAIAAEALRSRPRDSA